MANHERYLPCSHFRRFVVDAAVDLVGRTIVFSGDDPEQAPVRAMVLEAEAYGGVDDPASHAAFRPGGRAALMFGPAGGLYVYAAYGMYPCLNVVTEDEGIPGAVLIRDIQIEGGTRRITGPGRTSKALGITLDDHGASVCSERLKITCKRVPLSIARVSRIGVNRAKEIRWRFTAATR